MMSASSQANAENEVAVRANSESDYLAATARKHQKISVNALTILYISYFGFMASDHTGLGQQSDEVIYNHILRIAGVTISVLMVIYSITKYKIISTPSKLLKFMTLMYATYMVLAFVIFSIQGSVNYTTAYRIAEWFAIIVVCSQTMIKNRDYEADAINICKRLIKLTFLISATYYLVFHSAITIYGTDRFQLGGTAIHPNRIAFIGAVGILIFGMDAGKKINLVWTLCSAALVLAAASRIGYLLGALAAFAILILLVPKSLRSALTTLLAAMAIAALLLIIFTVGNPIDYFEADQEWSTLNGRTDIWAVGINMLWASPFVGWGLIQGAEQIGSLLNQPWWNATNAQGDILSAAISGGAVGLAMLLSLYILTISSIRHIRSSKFRRFFVYTVIFYFIAASFESIFIHVTTQVSIILIVLFSATSNIYRPSRRPEPSSFHQAIDDSHGADQPSLR